MDLAFVAGEDGQSSQQLARGLEPHDVVVVLRRHDLNTTVGSPVGVRRVGDVAVGPALLGRGVGLPLGQLTRGNRCFGDGDHGSSCQQGVQQGVPTGARERAGDLVAIRPGHGWGSDCPAAVGLASRVRRRPALSGATRSEPVSEDDLQRGVRIDHHPARSRHPGELEPDGTRWRLRRRSPGPAP
jgi:hypothetical protein